MWTAINRVIAASIVFGTCTPCGGPWYRHEGRRKRYAKVLPASERSIEDLSRWYFGTNCYPLSNFDRWPPRTRWLVLFRRRISRQPEAVATDSRDDRLLPFYSRHRRQDFVRACGNLVSLQNSLWSAYFDCGEGLTSVFAATGVRNRAVVGKIIPERPALPSTSVSGRNATDGLFF